MANEADGSASSADNELILAVKEKRVDTLEALIKDGHMLNTQDENGWTALRHAVEQNDAKAVKLLLMGGAEVHTADNVGDCCVKRAVELGLGDMLGLLLHEDGDPAQANEAGESAIHAAARLGREDLLAGMVKTRGATPPGVKDAIEGEDGEVTPLHLAAQYGHAEVVEYLLNCLVGGGAEPNLRDGRGETAIHKAAREGHEDVVSVLLRHLADPLITDNSGNNTFHHAAQHQAVLELLVREVNDPDALGVANAEAQTPLDLATDECAELLQKASQSPAPSSDKKRPDGSTVLMWACHNGELDKVKRLVRDKKTDVNARNVNRLTALHIAVDKDEADIIRELLRNGADCGLADKDGETPLYLACAHGQLDNVKAMLNKRADVTLRNKDGNTCLHAAASNGHMDVVKELLRHPGTKANMRNNVGHTPLMYAVYAGYQLAIVKALLAHEGVDVNAQSQGGETALHLALPVRLPAVVDLLLKHGAKADMTTLLSKQTPLHYAVVARSKAESEMDVANTTESIRLLLEHGKGFQCPRDFEGNTPLDLARKLCSDDVVELLTDLLAKHGQQVAQDDDAEYGTAMEVAADETSAARETAIDDDETQSPDEDECDMRKGTLGDELDMEEGGGDEGEGLAAIDRGGDVGIEESGDEGDGQEEQQPPATRASTRTVIQKMVEVIDVSSDGEEDEEEGVAMEVVAEGAKEKEKGRKQAARGGQEPEANQHEEKGPVEGAVHTLQELLSSAGVSRVSASTVGGRATGAKKAQEDVGDADETEDEEDGCRSPDLLAGVESDGEQEEEDTGREGKGKVAATTAGATAVSGSGTKAGAGPVAAEEEGQEAKMMDQDEGGREEEGKAEAELSASSSSAEAPPKYPLRSQSRAPPKAPECINLVDDEDDEDMPGIEVDDVPPPPMRRTSQEPTATLLQQQPDKPSAPRQEEDEEETQLQDVPSPPRRPRQQQEKKKEDCVPPPAPMQMDDEKEEGGAPQPEAAVEKEAVDKAQHERSARQQALVPWASQVIVEHQPDVDVAALQQEVTALREEKGRLQQELDRRDREIEDLRRRQLVDEEKRVQALRSVLLTLPALMPTTTGQDASPEQALEAFKQCLEGAGRQRAVERLDVQPSGPASAQLANLSQSVANGTGDRTANGTASDTGDRTVNGTASGTGNSTAKSTASGTGNNSTGKSTAKSTGNATAKSTTNGQTKKMKAAAMTVDLTEEADEEEEDEESSSNSDDDDDEWEELYAKKGKGKGKKRGRGRLAKAVKAKKVRTGRK